MINPLILAISVSLSVDSDCNDVSICYECPPDNKVVEILDSAMENKDYPKIIEAANHALAGCAGSGDARVLLELAASNGYPADIASLGFYLLDEGLQEEGEAMLRLAGEKGSRFAQFSLANKLSRGRKIEPEREREARALYEKLAWSGYAPAIATYSRILVAEESRTAELYALAWLIFLQEDAKGWFKAEDLALANSIREGLSESERASVRVIVDEIRMHVGRGD